MRASKLNRKVHRWASIVAALPLLVILLTGILLQFKKESDWIQPPTARGTGTRPAVSFDRILEAVKTVPEAGIRSWDDVDRLDVRPSKGVVKVRGKNRWEVQVDTQTAEVLQSAYRRSDLIEALHDGTFFHDAVKHWIFFPTAILLVALWITGVYLFLLPYFKRNSATAR